MEQYNDSYYKRMLRQMMNQKTNFGFALARNAPVLNSVLKKRDYEALSIYIIRHKPSLQ